MRRTKIVCTLGPAVDDENLLRSLMLKGMNAARFNFSHGDHQSHKALMDKFKKVRDELGLAIPAILDTKGPEIRTGKFTESQVDMQKGANVIIVMGDEAGNAGRFSVSYKELYREVKPGNKILIDDGLVELMVLSVTGTEIECIVLNGGVISGNKGVNVPNVNISLPALTDKDVDDIQFGVENGFDFIAASFVRKASDVAEIKKVLQDCGGTDVRVIAKIENRQGVENIDDIIETADAIMVARGDLGVEIPVFEVPILQKMMIRKCHQSGKPAIIATQMLDSMIRNPRPTRAEASDVANAVYDGTACVMLSGETASGKYPAESVETMVNIVETAEAAINYWDLFKKDSFRMEKSVTNAISHACCTTALDLEATAIVSVTQSGHTARMLSRFKPQCPIVAVTVNERVQRQLSLSWGINAYLGEAVTSTDELFEAGAQKALEAKIANRGDLVVITAGVPVGVSGTTNLIRVQTL
jgi:pyruvate kinase